MENSIKVIITDLDGTLLNNQHQISEFTKNVFQQLHKSNFLIIIATGRHHLDAMPIVENLGCPHYLVTSNGARIHSPSGELMYSFDIQSDAIKKILDLEIDPEITTVLFQEKVWLSNKINQKLNSFQVKMNYPNEVVDFKKVDNLNAIKLLFTHEDHNLLVALREKIMKVHSNQFHSAFSLPFCLEFMDQSVDKCFAIAKILEIENKTFEQALAFGDGFNDQNMLKAAGKALIMENAVESLKTQLNDIEVISTNELDGVACYLVNKVLNVKDAVL